MLADIKSLGTKQIMFIVDNFIGNISWTKQFLERIKPLKLNWNAAVNMKIGQYPEFMDLMKETGCQSLFIG
ncbi:B12-binding domain-containing radical SAM protein, partial [Veillonella atypica]|nr:B12-binding domain-containing radical SAM protein [Veillonella atypica]